MAGLPGTGKTTLARALAERVNGVVLSKDEVRAALFPEHLIDFSVEQDDLCMNAVIRAAQYLAKPECASFIFFDGRTFSRSYQIEQVITAAETCGAAGRSCICGVPMTSRSSDWSKTAPKITWRRTVILICIWS